jgi:hypothetical protein
VLKLEIKKDKLSERIRNKKQGRRFNKKDFSIKFGFVPTRRLAFDQEEAQKHKNLIRDKLLSWKLDFLNIDWFNKKGMP